MRDSTPTSDFPFRVIRYAGLILVIVGIIATVVDLGDVVYTAAKYTSGCDNVQYNGEPCSNSVLKWTWTASGIWGGLVHIAVGVIGWRLFSVDEYYLRFYRDVLAVLTVLGSLVIGPAMVALSILEIIYGLDLFYATEDSNFVLYDSAKFVLPIVNVATAFILWIAVTVTSVFVCCCAHFVEEMNEDDYYEDRYNGRRRIDDYSYNDRRRIDDYSYLDRQRMDDYSYSRRSPERRRRRRVKRLDRRPLRMPVERVSPLRSQNYDYAMPRRALRAPPLPAIPLPMNQPPYTLSASNLSLGSMARPMYPNPYSTYSFGAPWTARA